MIETVYNIILKTIVYFPIFSVTALGIGMLKDYIEVKYYHDNIKKII